MNLQSLKTRISKFKFIIFLSIALIIIAIQMKIIGIENFILGMSGLNSFFILLFFISYGLQFFLRAYLCQRISKTMTLPISYSTAYFSLGVCWMMNELLPGKLGDLARIEIISQREQIPFGSASAPIIFQRIVELAVLLIIGGITMVSLLAEDSLSLISQDNRVLFGFLFGIFLIISAVLLIVLITKYPQTIKIIVGRISNKLADWVSKLIDTFNAAINSIDKPFILILKSSLISLVYWFMDVLTFYFTFLAVGIQIDLLLAFSAGIITYLVKMFPLTPGGWGIAESISALYLLTIYPLLAVETALFVLILNHFLVFLYCCAYGLVSLFVLFGIKKSSPPKQIDTQEG